MIQVLAIVAAICAAVPAIMFCMNLRLYVPPAALSHRALPAISVLIPARNEAAGIAACVRSVLGSVGAEFEVIVMDDASTDGTGEIVRELMRSDGRVSLQQAPLLPPGWNGKQHACWALANAAKGEVLCFVDADVRLAPDAIARMAGFLVESQSALVSGFPRQVTETWMEWMLLPLIHFVLLGFLPVAQMRKTKNPGFAAGCGQFLMVERAAYFASGGHAGIRETMHDGLRLPRLLRERGYRTDLADLTELATCRMYRNAAEVWQGLAKNATEGLGAPIRIVPVSLVLVFGQIMPYLLVVELAGLQRLGSVAGGFAVAALVLAWLPRALAVVRFRQPVAGAVLHPSGMLMLLAIQWYALARKLTGGAVSWKSRAYVGE